MRLILNLRGLPQRLPEGFRNCFAANPADDFLFNQGLTTDDIRAGNLSKFGNPRRDRPIQLLVWGDSHAMSALPAFDSLFKEWGVAGRAATHSNTAPVLGWYKSLPYGQNEASPAYNEAVVSYIRQHRIPHVVMIANWQTYDTEASPQRSATLGIESDKSSLSLKSQLLATVDELIRIGCQPWIMLSVPTHRYDVPKVLAKACLLSEDEARFCSKPGNWTGLVGNDPEFLKQIQSAGARLIDPRPAFIESHDNVYRMSLDGVALYRDGGHLTKRGAEMMLKPVVAAAFSDVFRSYASSH